MKISGISCLFASLSLNLVSGFLLKRDVFDIEYDLKRISSECNTELQGALKCLNKIDSEFETKSKLLDELDIPGFCNPSNIRTDAYKCKNIDECKDFLAEDTVTNIIKSSKCNSDRSEIDILEKLATLKSVYLMGCGTNKSGELCPLPNYLSSDGVDFLFNHKKNFLKLVNQEYEDNRNEFEEVLDLSNDVLTFLPVLQDLNDILADSCNDSACNKNILAMNKIVVAARNAYEKERNIDLAKNYPKIISLYENYLDNYRNQKCENVSINNTSGTGSTIKKITYSFVTMMAVTTSLLLLL
ncbi:hypothetical protein PIROE2DRAFT_13651 [Piromyces sp. E2]|nr:hypothetical protein PIROE2DRAFT_13651 [Piromyces sp. E2]|eukprot:OUM60566.1 hypothetical protein PIROE2DRAFT_13651 [Piromyces sp. E2]